MYIYIYICVYVCVYIYMFYTVYIYIYTYYAEPRTSGLEAGAGLGVRVPRRLPGSTNDNKIK